MIQSEKINIAIVDDHQIFLEGLSSLLKEFKEITIVATAKNGNEALKILEEKVVDVVITDINMPGMDGLQLTKEIKKRYSHINILALTMHNDGRIISNMLKSGITGYILKNTGKDELFEAIQKVARGETFFSEEVTATLMTSMLPGKKQGLNNLPELSQREKEILKLIAAEYTQQQIADKLFISSHTVIFHRRNLLHKFNSKNTAGLIKAAMEQGFIE